MASMAQASECGHWYEVPRRTRIVRKNCSKACASRASYARRKADIQAKQRQETLVRLAATVKVCRNCGSDFTPGSTSAQKFCSKACSRNFHRRMCRLRICRAMSARGTVLRPMRCRLDLLAARCRARS